ncbi:HD domain-containing protein [Glutamicibacter sp. PS]|uniref:HD domain-containing protein n=1 Tax=Glutamicibacter sp. PS TaxID=3075634 RepID=UPI00283E3455|nr:HD domain-containing protein [Glutamicibacter sp. PS]MDR4532956.1 HD domain-containing protein [Glutamicibacter sp. PS]
MNVLTADLRTIFHMPQTELSSQALDFVAAIEPGFLYRHSLRSYLFARELAGQQELRPGADYDDETLFLSCLLHDVGLCETGNGNQRFEVDGADLAARFLKEHSVDEERISVVWDAVALHTSDGIAHRKGPVAALTQAGAALDVLGRDSAQLPSDFAERVHAAFPREDLAYAITDAILTQATDNPAKASPLSFPGQVLRRHLPAGELPDWQDLIMQSAWGDQPITRA